ncbi:MAG: purine/pyrimidine permease [Alistipes sp.]|nr:purine/pyrimidine permease [Alistipes sp.]
MKYNVDDKLPLGAMALYGMQWFILAIAVVTTSVFVATGTPAEKLFFAQKLFAVMGVAGLVQVLFGHRLPIVAGPAAVLLVGVLSALESGASSNAIYSSIAVGGALLLLLSFGGLLPYVQRLFSARSVIVILMLIALTLAPVIRDLIFPAKASCEEHAFGLIFTFVALPLMVLMNGRLRGVAKSLTIPIILVLGSIVYGVLFGYELNTSTSASLSTLFISDFEFDLGVMIAFIICYIALLINDIGSVESLGTMLGSDKMEGRLNRGIRLTGVMNIVAGALGVLGPVNFSMSPGVIASTRCASRYALIPSTLLLIVCALSPDIIALLTAIPNTVIGVILLFLMGTQLAASFEMMHSTRAISSFGEALNVGLPLMVAMLCQLMPRGIVPSIIEPLICNGFAMGVIMALLMEHVINRVER